MVVQYNVTMVEIESLPAVYEELARILKPIRKLWRNINFVRIKKHSFIFG